MERYGKPQVRVPTPDGGEAYTYLTTHSGTDRLGPWSQTTSQTFYLDAQGRVIRWD